MTSSVSEQDKSRAVIGGQDGAILPARDMGFVPQEKFISVLVFYPLK